jgi:hypothetical protein
MKKVGCENCGRGKVTGERYCATCRKALLKKMEESGYLTPKPFEKWRTSDMQEDQRETKWGHWNG